MSDAQHKPQLDDRIKTRGQRGRSNAGTALFVGLRLFDGFVLQRAILAANPSPLASFIHRLGIFSAPLSSPPAGDDGLVGFVAAGGNLTPFQNVLWGMAIGSALKQSFWLMYVANEPLYPKYAFAVAVFNTIMNSTNALLFGVAGSNPAWHPSLILGSIVIYTTGIFLETVSELQRKSFKDSPENAGKPYAGGLWSTARHVNYFGYMLWRSGFALAGGGVVWGVVQAVFFSFDFLHRGIPVLDQYCEKRYGEQWRRVRQKVPYKFVPWTY